MHRRDCMSLPAFAVCIGFRSFAVCIGFRCFIRRTSHLIGVAAFLSPFPPTILRTLADRRQKSTGTLIEGEVITTLRKRSTRYRCGGLFHFANETSLRFLQGGTPLGKIRYISMCGMMTINQVSGSVCKTLAAATLEAWMDDPSPPRSIWRTVLIGTRELQGLIEDEAPCTVTEPIDRVVPVHAASLKASRGARRPESKCTRSTRCGLG